MARDLSSLGADLQKRLDERPYATLAAIAALGWIVGRRRLWSPFVALAATGLGNTRQDASRSVPTLDQ